MMILLVVKQIQISPSFINDFVSTTVRKLTEKAISQIF